jgi:hypothetical protein
VLYKKLGVWLKVEKELLLFQGALRVRRRANFFLLSERDAEGAGVVVSNMVNVWPADGRTFSESMREALLPMMLFGVCGKEE